MSYLVYKTTNLVNGKYYIGSHRGTKGDSYLGSGKLLKAAIKKYGIQNFKREILYEAETAEEMYAKEAELVSIGGDSYNLMPGGYGGFAHLNTPEGIRNRSKTFKKWYTAGAKAFRKKLQTDKVFAKKIKDNALKASQASVLKGPVCSFQGKRHTEKTKRKIGLTNSKRLRGKNNAMFGKMWIHNPSTKKNACIKNIESIPDGWIKGRRLKYGRTENTATQHWHTSQIARLA